ncbi:MAG: hypothetical protein SFY70_01420 [Bacteroidia bacterium]|nr:hypothetical protein [Bacteroidia bacterium]
MSLSNYELVYLGVAGVFYLLTFVSPRLMRFMVRDPKTALTKESRWVREKTLRFVQRAFRYTFPLVAALMFTAFDKWLGGLYWLIPGLYTALGALYSWRLKRQWQQWQLLGYDGPPELQEQSEKLAASLPTTHVPTDE